MRSTKRISAVFKAAFIGIFGIFIMPCDNQRVLWSSQLHPFPLIRPLHPPLSLHSLGLRPQKSDSKEERDGDVGDHDGGELPKSGVADQALEKRDRPEYKRAGAYNATSSICVTASRTCLYCA